MRTESLSFRTVCISYEMLVCFKGRDGHDGHKDLLRHQKRARQSLQARLKTALGSRLHYPYIGSDATTPYGGYDPPF